MMMRSVLYVECSQCQLTETTVRGLPCCHTRTHYSDSEPISLCSVSLMMRDQRRTTNSNLIVFDLTRSGVELTSYRSRGEHANHSTTDAVREEYDNRGYGCCLPLTQLVGTHLLYMYAEQTKLYEEAKYQTKETILFFAFNILL